MKFTLNIMICFEVKLYLGLTDDTTLIQHDKITSHGAIFPSYLLAICNIFDTH